MTACEEDECGGDVGEYPTVARPRFRRRGRCWSDGRPRRRRWATRGDARGEPRRRRRRRQRGRVTQGSGRRRRGGVPGAGDGREATAGQQQGAWARKTSDTRTTARPASEDPAEAGRASDGGGTTPAETVRSSDTTVTIDDHWRWLRALCKGEIFSIRRVEAHSGLREGKARVMVELLLRRQGEEVKVGELVFRTIFNMLGNMLFSRDVLAAGGEEGGENGDGSWNLKETVSRSLQLVMTPNLEDFYAAAFGGLDLQGLRREVRKNLDMIYEVFDGVIRERRVEMEEGTGGEQVDGKEDFLKVLLDAGCEDVQLKALFLDIFTAGADTSTALVEWTMSELVKNPHVMTRLREELQRVVGSPDRGTTSIRESHLAHLPYLQACIKETLRLHPPVPLLLPHLAVDACEVMGYEVPSGCTVIVNVWAIGRDPEVWKDPLRFRPERFLEACSVNYMGMDFEFVPFGAGRRICPGLPVAARAAPLVVASMVHGFEWCLPGGMEADQLGMTERLGLVLEREQRLVLVPTSISLAG